MYNFWEPSLQDTSTSCLQLSHLSLHFAAWPLKGLILKSKCKCHHLGKIKWWSGRLCPWGLVEHRYFTSCYRQNVCVPQNSYIGNLIHNVMIFRGWAAREVIRSRGWRLYEWELCLCKRGPRDVPSPSPFLIMGRHHEKPALYKPGSDHLPDTVCSCLDFGPFSLKDYKKWMLIVYKPPSSWFFVLATWVDEDPSLLMSYITTVTGEEKKLLSVFENLLFLLLVLALVLLHLLVFSRGSLLGHRLLLSPAFYSPRWRSSFRT